MGLTFNGTFELDIEFLHVIVDECNFVIAHQAIDDRLEDSCKRQSCEVIRGEGESGGKSREWGMREGTSSSSAEDSDGRACTVTYSFITSVSIRRLGELCKRDKPRYRDVSLISFDK